MVLLGKDVVLSRANSPSRSRPASQERQHNSSLHELPPSHKPPLKPFSSEILRQFKNKQSSIARENSDMKQPHQPEDNRVYGNSHGHQSRLSSSYGDHPPQQSIITDLCHRGHAGNTSMALNDLTPDSTMLDGQSAAQPQHNRSYTNAASRAGSVEAQAQQNGSARAHAVAGPRRSTAATHRASTSLKPSSLFPEGLSLDQRR